MQYTYNDDGTLATNDDGTLKTAEVKQTFTLGSVVGSSEDLASSTSTDLKALTINGTQYGLKMNFQGNDTSTTITKNLSDTLQIQGVAKVATDAASGTLATASTTNVVVKADTSNDTLDIALNKDINLDSQTDSTSNRDGSLTAGGVTVGVIKTEDDGTITKRGINFGSTSDVGNQGINLASGVNGTLWTSLPQSGSFSTNQINANLNNAANIGDIYAIAGSAAAAVAEGKHTIVTVGGQSEPVAGDNTEFGNYVNGGNLQIRAKDVDGQKTYDLRLADNVTLGQKGADGQDGVDGSVGVNGKDGQNVTIDGEKGITIRGKDGADGQNGKDAVTIYGKDGVDGVDGAEGHVGLNGKDGMTDIRTDRGQVGVDGTDGHDGTDGMTRIIYKDPEGYDHEVATLDDGLKIGANAAEVTGEDNPVANKLNSTVKIVGEEAQDGHSYTIKNLTTTVAQKDGDTTVTIKMDKDLTDLNSVTLGDTTTNNYTTINSDGIKITNITNEGDKSITINKNTVNMGGSQIHNVAPGTADTDAVNVSQLRGGISNVNNRIDYVSNRVNKLGTRIDRVGAGAAALAALHPLDFDPDAKWDFAAGYGNYRGEHAVAVGAYYRPNEDTMLSMGGSFGGGENMVNAGVSVKVGAGSSHVTNSRVAMAKDMLAMQETINALVKKVQKLEAGNAGKKAPDVVEKDISFPDVPANHWAYEYVTELAKRGLVEGYPDGEFKGDRTLTRYEYAAIVYRALQNGAPVDSNMARSMNEFGDEMAGFDKAYRFRVDRVAGKDNDRHKIERVRVNDEDNEEAGDYRDMYGSRIQKEAAAQ